MPFELFQNADDAAAELAEMFGEQQLPAASRRFVLIHQPAQLTFLHWGRAINRVRGGKISSTEGRDRGFNRDLEKMLVLSSSDKPGEDGSTGKFGLGFKSVFLVCDKPRIVSRDMAVEVIGGIFPQVLETDRSRPLRRLLAENAGDHEGDNTEGTAIDLPLDVKVAAQSRLILDQYVELGHVLPVFARKIRECVLTDTQGRKQTARWESKAVNHCESIRFGAPTTELKGSGIAVNGAFEVDVGRTQLARTAFANKQQAQVLGEKLGQLLEQLNQVSADWDPVRTDLQLARDAAPGELWRSLWDVLVEASFTESSGASPASPPTAPHSLGEGLRYGLVAVTSRRATQRPA